MTGRITESGVITPWLKISQAREYLQISDTDFRAMVNRGEIPSVRRGNTKFCHVEDLDAWMRQHPSGATSLLTQC